MQMVSGCTDCIRAKRQTCATFCVIEKENEEWTYGVFASSWERSSSADSLTCLILFVVAASRADGSSIAHLRLRKREKRMAS